MTPVSVTHQWIGLVVTFFAAGAIGFAAGMAKDGRAAADVVPADANIYTYSAGLCNLGDEKEPINVVFVNHGLASEIKQQAINHGGWEVETTSPQYFGDQYGCYQMDGGPASNNGQFPLHNGRYHMRHYNLEAPGGGIRTVPPYGSISLAAAHHEDVVTCTTEEFPYINPSSHAPDDNSEGIFIDGLNITVAGGFNAGREDIRKNWVHFGDHVIVSNRYWNNRQRMDQCNGNETFSDGYVYYITTFEPDPDDTDGDGCDDVYENGSDPTEGGLRDPADPWDYYDVSLPTDGVIDLFNDILGVIIHYSLDGSPPYDAYYDRGPQPEGANSWEKTAPDGIIDLFTDILGVIIQYDHNCN